MSRRKPKRAPQISALSSQVDRLAGKLPEAPDAGVGSAVSAAVEAALEAVGWDPAAVAQIAVGGVATLHSLTLGGAIKPDVDQAAGIIRNCAVMTVGPTLGHPFAIDMETLIGVRDLVNAQPDGVKSRFKHPGAAKAPDGSLVVADDAGSVVGQLLPTTRIEGNTLRGDVKLGAYAATLPGQGDARAYLMSIARENPSAIGLSVVFAWTPDRGADGSVVARAEAVQACDFVGKPAANPNGLLSATPSPTPPAPKTPAAPGKNSGPPAGKRSPMDPKLKAHLVAMGMDSDSSDEAAMAWHAGLSNAAKAQLTAKMAAPPDTGDEPDDDDIDPGEMDDEADDKKAAKGAKMKAKCSARISAIDTRIAALAAAGLQAPVKLLFRKTNLATKAAAVDAKLGAAAADPVAQERKRVTQLTELGALLKLPEAIVRQQIAAGATAVTARTAFLSALAAQNPAVPGAIISVGKDQQHMAMLQAVPEAIAMRAGVAKVDKPHEMAVKMQHMSVLDIGRRYLAALGATDIEYMSRPAMADLLLSRSTLRQRMPQVAMLAESVGDFPAILLDAINKTFRPLYLDAPKTWPVWVRRSSNPDFKNINRTALSESPSLVKRDAGGQISYVALTDGKETYSLAEYIGGIKITRKAIINDDLDAFGRIPQLQSNACWRAEEETVYGVLTTNAALGVDGVALFNSAHGNLISAGGGAPSTTTVTATEALMLTQKGPQKKARLALRPQFIITPVTIKRTTQQFLTSTDLIATISTTSSAPVTVGSKNVFAGELKHVFTPVLDDTSTAAWYMAADYKDGQVDTIEICFLDGEPEPVLRQQTVFDSEDVIFAVRHTLAAKGIDFRGLVKNPGA